MEHRTPDKGLPLVILAGPTAVGKSELAVSLARRIGGEIISADSMQVYRGMDIGSAKITKEEMRGIPHHLIDVLDPAEPFDVVRFQQLAKDAISAVIGRGHIPILAGGTGFYIQAVLYDIDFSADGESENDYRKALEAAAATQEGRDDLYKQLLAADPEAAAGIHPHNCKRVIRALEYYHQTGRKISEHNEEQKQKASPYNFAYFVLTDDRSALYGRIDKRVDRMLEEGLVEEVRRLQTQGCKKNFVSMQGLGYKEIFAYLDGECTLEEAAYIIRRDTRHFAKRQLTWFRREPDVVWLDRSIIPTEEALLQQMEQVLEDRQILNR